MSDKHPYSFYWDSSDGKTYKLLRLDSTEEYYWIFESGTKDLIEIRDDKLYQEVIENMLNSGVEIVQVESLHAFSYPDIPPLSELLGDAVEVRVRDYPIEFWLSIARFREDIEELMEQDGTTTVFRKLLPDDK